MFEAFRVEFIDENGPKGQLRKRHQKDLGPIKTGVTWLIRLGRSLRPCRKVGLVHKYNHGLAAGPIWRSAKIN